MFVVDPATVPTESIRRRFDRAAADYDVGATAQARMAADLFSLISSHTPTETIVDVGCGSGFLTEHLVRAFPSSKVYGIDVSAKMLELCARRVRPFTDRFEPLCVDARALRGLSEADLIVSSAALQWLMPLETILPQLRAWLKPGGRFLAVILVAGTLNEVYEARSIATGLPNESWLPSGDEVLEQLSAVGFAVTHSEIRDYREEFADSTALLQGLSRFGFTAQAAGQTRNLLQREQLQRLRTELSRIFTPGPPTLNYRALLVSATLEAATPKRELPPRSSRQSNAP